MNTERIRKQIRRFKQADAQTGLSEARARLIRYYNGGAPYTDDQVEEFRIYTNVQTFLGPRILMDARRQLLQLHRNALTLFRVRINQAGPRDEEASDWITRTLNQILRNDRAYTDRLIADDASLVLHGVAVGLWPSEREWRPIHVAVEDFKLPIHAYADLSNVSSFAIYQEMSVAEIYSRWVHADSGTGWDKSAVQQLLKKLLKGESVKSLSDTEWALYFEEKLADDFRTGACTLTGTDIEAIKATPVWYFYHQEDDGWHLTILLEQPEPDEPENPLYRSPGPLADDIHQILSVHYADGSCKPPFRYHAIRGLAYMLYPLVHQHDRAFCRVCDALNDSLNQYYRDLGSGERAQDLHIILPNHSVIDPAVRFVTAAERYTVNPQMVRMYMEMTRQLISEQSSSYTRDLADGTRTSMTATEAQARLYNATQITESVLSLRTLYLEREWREICRRFCDKRVTDKEAVSFRKQVEKLFGRKYLDYERWTVSAESPIASGNQSLTMERANLLFLNRSAFNPSAQRQIRREWLAAVTGDPNKAMMLEPDAPPPASNAVIFGRLALGSLLDGVMVEIPESIDMLEYGLTIADGLIQRFQLMQTGGGTPTAGETAGFITALGHLRDVLEALSADPAQKGLVTALMQQWSIMAQQAAAWAKDNSAVDGMTPKQRAEIMAIMAKNQAKIEQGQRRAALNEFERQQELEHRAQKFRQDLAYKAAEARLKQQPQPQTK